MRITTHYRRQLGELYNDKFFLLAEITLANLSYFSMKLKKNHFVLIYILDSMRKKKCELTQQNYGCVASDKRRNLNWHPNKFINLKLRPRPFPWLDFKDIEIHCGKPTYVSEHSLFFFCSVLLFLKHLYQYSSESSALHLSRAHHFLIKVTWLGPRFTSLRSCYLPWINYRKTCWLIDVACQKRR